MKKTEDTSDETEVTFWDDEEESIKPTQKVDEDETTTSIKEDKTKPRTTSKLYRGYTSVKHSQGEAKATEGTIIIETFVKGLIYKSVVFLDGEMINGTEVSCSELESKGNKENIFEQRYLSAHNNYKQQYIKEEIFYEVLSDSGFSKVKNSETGEKVRSKIITEVSTETISTVIYMDDIEVDRKELKIDEKMKGQKHLIEIKYQKLHDSMIEEHFEVEKFPVNTFLNPILKKLYFYKDNPMHSFYLFVLLSLLTLFLIKAFYCGFYLEGKKTKDLVKKGMMSQLNEMICGKVEDRCFVAKENHWDAKRYKKATFKNCQMAHTNIIISDEVWEELLKVPTEDIERCKIGQKKSWKKEDGSEDKALHETCQAWCDSGAIDKGICQEAVLSYNIVPEMLTLSLYDSQAIHIENKSTKSITVEVEDILLDDTSKPIEIIKLINGNPIRIVEVGEEAQFRYRLESSGVKYFDKGIKYEGIIKLLIDYDGERKHKKIRFNFTLDDM